MVKGRSLLKVSPEWLARSVGTSSRTSEEWRRAQHPEEELQPTRYRLHRKQPAPEVAHDDNDEAIDIGPELETEAENRGRSRSREGGPRKPPRRLRGGPTFRNKSGQTLRPATGMRRMPLSRSRYLCQKAAGVSTKHWKTLGPTLWST